MEYIKIIKERLFFFSSVLNIKFNLKENFADFILALPEEEKSNPVSIFLKNLLIKFSEKFLKFKNADTHYQYFEIYLIFLTNILLSLENYEKNYLIKTQECFYKIKDKLLSPLKMNQVIKSNTSSNILSLQLKLENDFNNFYNHLFLPEEISLLSIVLITKILDSEDLLNPNLFVKSINTSGITSNIRLQNEFILRTDYNNQIFKFFKNMENFFKIASLTDVK
jgi:hypothetical protein